MTTCGKMIILLTMLTTGGEQILLPMVAANWPPGSRSPSNCSPPCCKTQFPQSIFLLYGFNLWFERQSKLFRNDPCRWQSNKETSDLSPTFSKFLQLRVEDPLCNYSSRLPWQWARERIALLAIWERERRERHTWVALELETLCTGETFQGRQPSPGNLWLSFWKFHNHKIKP